MYYRMLFVLHNSHERGKSLKQETSSSFEFSPLSLEIYESPCVKFQVENANKHKILPDHNEELFQQLLRLFMPSAVRSINSFQVLLGN